MSLIWSRRWPKLVLLGLTALIISYVVSCNRLQERRRLATLTEDENASVGWEPVSFWRQSSLAGLLQKSPASPHVSMHSSLVLLDNQPAAEDTNRKIVRAAALEIEVKDAATSLQQIRGVAERVGGYLESSETAGAETPAGNITIRVPTPRFEEVLGEIRKLAVRIESEKVNATDVTRNYVDREAKLRNLRAEESQYLTILKRASSVQDTLDVSSKLNEVRGEIEEQQAEFAALTKQVETVAISVSLVPTADTHVFGMHWRPWYTVKLAAHDGLDGLGSFAGTVTATVFLLPTILLWLAFVVLSLAIAVRMLRWIWRVFFTFPKRNPPAAQPAPAG